MCAADLPGHSSRCQRWCTPSHGSCQQLLKLLRRAGRQQRRRRCTLRGPTRLLWHRAAFSLRPVRLFCAASLAQVICHGGCHSGSITSAGSRSEPPFYRHAGNSYIHTCSQFNLAPAPIPTYLMHMPFFKEWCTKTHMRMDTMHHPACVASSVGAPPSHACGDAYGPDKTQPQLLVACPPSLEIITR